jgi:hypothetical protein
VGLEKRLHGDRNCIGHSPLVFSHWDSGLMVWVG